MHRLTPGIKYLVLDVLKPHEPSISDLALKLCSVDNVRKVDISLLEVDERTTSLKVILEGSSMDLESIRKRIEEMGAVIHSVDQVTVERTK